MIDLTKLNRWRVINEAVMALYGNVGDGTCGAFEMRSPIDGEPLHIIASQDGGWDHVSVSRKNRAPNQREMDHIFRLFFPEGETAVQYFVPYTDHVNVAPTCLHLWRSQDQPMPRPTQLFV